MTPVTAVARARDELVKAVAALYPTAAVDHARDIAHYDLSAAEEHLEFLCGGHKPPREGRYSS